MNTLNVSKALKICSAVRSNSDGNNVLNDTEPSDRKSVIFSLYRGIIACFTSKSRDGRIKYWETGFPLII